MDNAGTRLVVLALCNPHLQQVRRLLSGGCVKLQMQQAMASTAPDAKCTAGPDVTASSMAMTKEQAVRSESSLTCWNVDRDARIEPPIQTLYLRSGGATTLTFMLDGARAVISLFIRSAMPGNMVVPPVYHPMLPCKHRQAEHAAGCAHSVHVVASSAYRPAVSSTSCCTATATRPDCSTSQRPCLVLNMTRIRGPC